VEPGTLHQACRCAGALLWTALTASSADIAALAER
jgi:hypothetical protein